MGKDSHKVELKLAIPPGFNVNVTIGDNTYHVQTENGGTKNPVVTTYIYQKGEIVYSKKTNYSDILNEKDFNERLYAIMDAQHKNSIDEFTTRIKESRKKIHYFDAVKKLLVRKNNKEALKLLQDALSEFPDDPFILSYYGYLIAAVEKKFDAGIKICKDAFKKLGSDMPSEEEKTLYTAFYLNLGKAYLAGGDRRSAIEALNSGLKIDENNHDLLWELKKMGERKIHVIPFLPRSNPINKYMGILISRLKRR